MGKESGGEVFRIPSKKLVKWLWDPSIFSFCDNAKQLVFYGAAVCAADRSHELDRNYEVCCTGDPFGSIQLRRALSFAIRSMRAIKAWTSVERSSIFFVLQMKFHLVENVNLYFSPKLHSAP